jgi:hypothetical protein
VEDTRAGASLRQAGEWVRAGVVAGSKPFSGRDLEETETERVGQRRAIWLGEANPASHLVDTP